jgi:hypothetical protein
MSEKPMSRKTPDPLWTVRGVCRDQDVCLVTQAPSATAAECFATKRAIDVVVVTPATSSEIAEAKAAGRLWRYTPLPRLRCFGRPVGQLQAACLVLCGVATLMLDLHAHRVPLPRIHW